jgi:hypothetical protein
MSAVDARRASWRAEKITFLDNKTEKMGTVIVVFTRQWDEKKGCYTT